MVRVRLEGDVLIPQMSGDDEYVRENLTAPFHTHREAAELLGVGPDEVGQATRQQSFNEPVISCGPTGMYYTPSGYNTFSLLLGIKSVLPPPSTRFFLKITCSNPYWVAQLIIPPFFFQ